MAGGARAAPPAGLWPPGPPCHGNRPEWSCRGFTAMQAVMVLPGKLLSYQNYLIILVNYLVKLGRRVDVGRKALPFSGWLPTQHIS